MRYRISARYFYPRSPCGERLDGSKSSIEEVSILIHALLAESDVLSFMFPVVFLSYFYPRSPCGELPCAIIANVLV